MDGEKVIIQHAEKVYIGTEAIQAEPVTADTSEFLSEQIRSGASPEALHDMGYNDVPEEVEQIEPTDDEATVVQYKTPEERNDPAAINATARANLLRNMIKHADRARRLEGLQTNHQNRPDDPKKVDAIQHSEKVMAEESLLNACGHCALSNSCRLVSKIEKWFDAHPYKHEKGKLRPGSGPVLVTESKADFLKVLEDDPMAHCDPARRQPKAA